MADLQWPLLSKGDVSDDVGAAQYLLWCWGQKLNPDNRFGDNTEKAVKAFQQAVGLTQDGKIGKETWPRMTDGKAIPKCLAKRGDKGHCVGAVQAELVKHDLLTKIDGDFQNGTEHAVRMFQQKVAIPDTGRVDAITWKNLVCRTHI